MDFSSSLEATARISTPILLAGLGEMVLERSGMINIGIEGVMLGGAFFGFCAGWASGSPLIGAAAGMLAGAIMMSVYALVTLRFKADQIVTGMAINLLALGITGTAYLAITRSYPDARAVTFEPVAPSLSEIPLLGPLLFSQTVITWAALLLIPLIWFYLERSERGLELRAVGEHPAAAESSGIRVLFTRYKACLAAGVLCGLGGAFLTISQTAFFANNCTRGRGFVALAAVVLGLYGSFGTAAACLFFGAAFYARDAFPGASLPTDIVEMLPYLLTVVALCLRSKARGAPAALGKPYG
ncbi:MAG TPA: ABC transporter permease [Planctomycetota bacterium]|nr:ABC transporter permease [Planctomycetota bacterium]